MNNTQLKRYWRVTEGNSRAKVLATDYFAAIERAKEIGFGRPESVVLDEELTPMQAAEGLARCTGSVSATVDDGRGNTATWNREGQKE